MATVVITETPTLQAPSVKMPSPSVAASTTESVTSGIGNITSRINLNDVLRYSLIILILAFLGFNLFSYLGKITEETAGFLQPILSFFGYGATAVIKQTTKVAATGTKGLVDVAAGTVTSGVDLLEKGIESRGKGKGQGQLRNKIDDTSDSTGIALDNAVSTQSQSQSSSDPIPDDAGSRTQLSRANGKSGYCYIGEDRGFRSCIKVGEADMCMSGDIFPSQEICINPNLRE